MIIFSRQESAILPCVIFGHPVFWNIYVSDLFLILLLRKISLLISKIYVYKIVANFC